MLLSAHARYFYIFLLYYNNDVFMTKGHFYTHFIALNGQKKQICIVYYVCVVRPTGGRGEKNKCVVADGADTM